MKTKKSEQTRQFIIEKAAILFNQKGYAGTSMSDIMEATGLTKGGIYGNFKRGEKNKEGVKEEIALAAFVYSVDSINQHIRQRTRVIDNAVDKLKTVVYYYKERIFNPLIEGGCPILNASIDADDTNPRLKERVVEALTQWYERVVYTIQKGIEKGEIKKDTDAAANATLFIGILEGGIMLARIHDDINRFNTMADHMIKMLEEMKA